MKKKMTALILALVMALTLMTACSQAEPEAPVIQLSNGGVLLLRVNPEIAVEYDTDGIVTGVSARNEDALAIISSCTGLIGQEARTAVTKLVTAIGDAGYFVEEIDGTKRQITLEIEPGSSLPSDTFLDDVIADIRNTVSSHDWTTPLNVEGESILGKPDYVDTDYGPGNDGFTDYKDTDYGPNNDGVTDYLPGATTPSGETAPVYVDTDYGPNNDGVTDFGLTDYNNTDYGPNNDGITDYNDTDYGPNNDGVTNYTDYGTAAPAAPKTPAAPAAPTAPKTATQSGSTQHHTDYGRTDYDSHTNYDHHTDYGNTNYDHHTNYGNSGYSDYD